MNDLLIPVLVVAAIAVAVGYIVTLFPRRPFLHDLHAGQEWISSDETIVWEIVKIDCLGVLTLHCKFDNGEFCRVNKTKSEFRLMLKKHGAKLHCG